MSDGYPFFTIGQWAYFQRTAHSQVYHVLVLAKGKKPDTYRVINKNGKSRDVHARNLKPSSARPARFSETRLGVQVLVTSRGNVVSLASNQIITSELSSHNLDHIMKNLY